MPSTNRTPVLNPPRTQRLWDMKPSKAVLSQARQNLLEQDQFTRYLDSVAWSDRHIARAEGDTLLEKYQSVRAKPPRYPVDDEDGVIAGTCGLTVFLSAGIGGSLAGPMGISLGLGAGALGAAAIVATSLVQNLRFRRQAKQNQMIGSIDTSRQADFDPDFQPLITEDVFKKLESERRAAYEQKDQSKVKTIQRAQARLHRVKQLPFEQTARKMSHRAKKDILAGLKALPKGVFVNRS